MSTVGNTPEEPNPALGGEKRPRSGNATYWQAHSFSRHLSTPNGNSKRILFLNERSGNVTENKGPLGKTFHRSRNVYENSGT
jgi:hypothetical protein